MNRFLVDYKKDVFFYSKIIDGSDEAEVFFKALKYLAPNYKIDCILDLGKCTAGEKIE